VELSIELFKKGTKAEGGTQAVEGEQNVQENPLRFSKRRKNVWGGSTAV